MKDSPARQPWRRLGAAALAALIGLHLVGCASKLHTFNSKRDTTFGKKREVANVHQTQQLPAELRRVAVLPLHQGAYDHIEMEPIAENFRLEIGKRNLFEVVAVTPDALQELFGRRSFSSVEPLPTKLLTKLYETYAIDGVLFLDVTHYSAYRPVALGVRAKLLDGHTGELVWAADETFDAANPAVSNAARKYFQTQSVNGYPLHETQSVLSSPARFSKYVAAALFGAIDEPR